MGIREVIREEADWCTLDEVTGQGRGRIQYEEGHVKEMSEESLFLWKLMSQLTYSNSKLAASEASHALV